MKKGQLLIALLLCAACRGSDADDESTTTAASALSQQPEAGLPEAGPGSGDFLPASYAGESSEQGPGRPFDATEPVKDTIPLNAAEQASAQEAKQKLDQRLSKKPVDIGFAPKGGSK